MELTSSKYGVSKTFDLPFIEYGTTDYLTGVSLAAGDVKVSKDNGAFANIAALPIVNGAWMEVTLSATEMQASRIKVQVIDQTATKIFEDTGAILNTDIINLILDEPCTGDTHNVKHSLGRRIRSIGNALGFSIVADGANTALTFKTDLPSTKDNFYNDQVIHGVGEDDENEDATRIVESYNGTTKFITIDEAFTDIPATGDEFEMRPEHIHPISQIVQEIIDDPAYGLAELLTAIKTRLASRPYVTEHPPATTDVTNGTVLEGDNGSVQTLNQEYLKIQETGMFKINHTFTGIDEIHSQIYLTYRYFGSGTTNHRIKARIWSYVLSEMVDITGEDRDLPATNEDRTLIFDLPGTLTDYYDGSIPNLTAKLEIEHLSNPGDEHFFWLDTIGFGGLETIYSAPDNESIEEIREFTETYIPFSVVAGGGKADPAYAEVNERSEIVQGDVVLIVRYLEGDHSSKTLFFGAKTESGDAVYAVGVIQCNNISYNAETDKTSYAIPFIASDTENTSAFIYKGETEIRDIDGISNPVTGDRYDFEVIGQIIVPTP